MKTKSIALTAIVVVVGLAGLKSPAAAEGTFVTPGPNTNIIGVTPNPGILNVPDFYLKQQNEPACIIRPSNKAYIFCAYNDMRASDEPLIQGDGWIGVSQSANRGQTWFSRLAPGYLGHPNPVGVGFAADPGLVAVPGNSPGLVILSYIGAFRDSDVGVMAIQRWVEFNQEDVNFWKPEIPFWIAADGSEGRFIDKPDIEYIISNDIPQLTITEPVTVEGEAQPIQVTTPAGIVVIAYAVFTGESGGAKIYIRKSFTNGVTWGQAKKISAELNEVNGVSISAIGDDFIVTYRRRGDVNEPDAIMSVACKTTGNQKCSKAQVAFEICPIDQQATGSTFRTFTFPWSANDGNRYWLFAAHLINSDGSCPIVDPALGVPPSTFSGTPRIVGMTSLDGKNWVGAEGQNSDEPFIIDWNDGFGKQVMPFAYGTKARIDVGWWDTRREEETPPGLPSGNVLLDGITPSPLINDYVSPVGRVYRKADIYMTRLTATADPVDCPTGGGPQTGCTPQINEPVRVSQYPIDILPGGILQETKANRLNLRTHSSGTRAFNGDYGAIATASHRKTDTGRWIPNSLPQQFDESNFVEREDIFMAWGDARDVVEDALPIDPAGPGQSLYSPPVNSAAPGFQANSREPGDSLDETLLADSPGVSTDVIHPDSDEMEVVTEPDDDPGLPSDISLDACSVQDFSRSRDTNVYGSMVDDKATLVALTQTRPLNTVQRMFPLVLYNPEEIAAAFCLEIENQPAAGRASFFPLPALPVATPAPKVLLDVVAPALSSASRSAFVTANGNDVVTVKAYEGACPPDLTAFPDSLIGSVELSNGDLFDSEFCQGAGCPLVAENETHELELVSPGLQAPVFQAPGLQAPVFQADQFQSPGLQAPGFQAPGFQADQVTSPSLQAEPILSPGLQAPSFQAPSLQAALLDEMAENYLDISYQDVTYVVKMDGNVTTTSSADIAVVGLNPLETEVEFIAWTPNVHTTSAIVNGDCFALPAADNQIIAAVNLGSPGLQASSLSDVTLPTAFTSANQKPYVGELSYHATPGQDIALTVRIWATGDTIQTLETLHAEFLACQAVDDVSICDPAKAGVNANIALGASTHGCSTTALQPDPDDTNNPDCLNLGNEKIEPPDTFPPIFSPPDGTTLSIDASSPAGVTINTVVGIPGTAGGIPDFIEITDAGGIVSKSCTFAGSGSPLNTPDTTIPFSSVSTDPGTGENTLVPTIIDCAATDAAGNLAEVSIAINVIDPFAPTLTRSELEITVLADAADGGVGGAFVDYAVAGQIFEATDDFTYPTPTVVNPDCTPASGSFFTITTTSVSCTVSDNGPNASADVNTSDPVTFDVTITDVAPTFSITPPSITVTATDPNQQSVNYADEGVVFTTSDNVPLPVDVDCVPPSGSDFVVGETTTVDCIATDSGELTAFAIFMVTVVDGTPPVITVPADIEVDTTNIGGVTIDYIDEVVVVDNVDPDPSLSCVPPSGSVFAIGTTQVTCTATDAAGNPPATATFNVTVNLVFDSTGVIPNGNPNNLRSGTSIPFFWAWLDENSVPVDIGSDNQLFEVWSGTCPLPGQPPSGILVADEDPGSSDIRQKADFSWQYNFQAVGFDGEDLPAIPPGTPYCAIVTLLDGGMPVQQQHGVFKLKP